ncbi:RagB/SusD family nutrient uptake outer membrane protein [Chitinophaga vietnamensis]|uniref:RagB/SusD family nutrient uptake outer membrane protein n=1 Tax=Chitinophaga vietnamensis TaxID=2593957 RepID=UPI001178B0BE|nr:RagB/SusD family nutrient uptake outer membrane protein [Chitinophaga vietnamensis]
MKKWKHASLLLVGAALLGSSCTKRFDEINKNPYDFDEEELRADYRLMGEPLSQAQLNIIVYNYPPTAQLQQNLNADIFSGYMMSPTPFEGNINNTNYGLLYYWNDKPWTMAYTGPMKSCDFAMQKAKDKYPDFYALAQIIRVEAMHRVSDIYGPIIYTHYGQVNEDKSIDYDTQQEAYYAFFKDLDQAIKVLTDSIKSGATQRFAAFDLVYKGDYTQWVKFANTLRLRLAIRISGVDPQKAKMEGEAALNHPLGLLQTPDDNFAVNISPVTHPLNIMCYTWADIRMSAPMESILTGYRDPRLQRYFVPTDEGPGIYHGIRNGINIPAKEQYSGFSMLTRFDSKILFMAAAEAWFLKAEAALNGWKGAGDARSNYEQGIATSFKQYNLTNADAYTNDNTSKPNAYVDPTNPQNNVPPGDPHLSTITIQWNDADPLPRKLERIITQKWIAMFPDGQEAWSEFRRTGYPKLFPVVINNSGGTISTEKFIRRLPFPQAEQITNPKAVARARQWLKGDDNGGTPLWWDQR